jgi:hypothetical protein
MKYNLTIGAFKWVLDDGVSNEVMENNLGLCDYENLTIEIKGGLVEGVRKATVLHELGHAFFASAGFDPKEEERVVDIMAAQMLSFLQQNKEFFKNYFLEDVKDI